MKTNSSMKTFGWLLRREFWEHRGGFFWAPLVAGSVWIVLTVLGFIVTQATVQRSKIEIHGMQLDQLTSRLDPAQLTALGQGIELSLYVIAGVIGMVVFFVLFFYCLGALYDERKDRSVLFWKSLPISNRETVLSKVTMALFVVPAIATLAAIATGLTFLLLLSLYGLFYGVNPWPLLWGTWVPWKVAFTMLALIPIQALWSLPCVGWLMLCSAWARSKPFLWALALPVGAGVMVSWFELMKSLQVPSTWFWEHVVSRVLLSVAPGSWVDFDSIDDNFDGPGDMLKVMDLNAAYSLLATPGLWIGAAAGIGMLMIAVHFRRKRDEG